MTELLTAAQMRAIEQAAIGSGEVTGLELMERAGQGVVEAIFAEWPDLAEPDQAAPAAGGQGGAAPSWPAAHSPPEYLGQNDAEARRAAVLCGPGNNGGDGFVIARLLAERGWVVEVFLYGDPEKLPPDARVNYERWTDLGEVSPIPSVAGGGPRPLLVIDAMFGTGLSRPIPLACAEAHLAVRKRKGRARCRVVAVDCPSGFDADTGDWLVPDPPDDDAAAHDFIRRDVTPRILVADLCVSFHRAKVGLWLAEATAKRRPLVVDIGLGDGPEVDDPACQLGTLGSSETVRLVAPPVDARPGSLRAWLSHAAFSHILGSHHKYDRGHVLVLGGGAGRGGAARLAARAALRGGAGLVTLGVPPAALAENAAHLNAIMLREVGDADAVAVALTDKRLSSVCLGPGLGVTDATREIVLAALTATASDDLPRRVVLDADALTIFSLAPQVLFDALHANCILTPHEGEFARLFPDLAEKQRRPLSKVDATRQAAERAGCAVLLKGPATVIASPDGTASIHGALYDRSLPWLGTAGAGDVLAGLIAGLVANPMAPFGLHQVIEVAAWLHAECARAFGPGLIAEDLPEQLPRVFSDLGL